MHVSPGTFRRRLPRLAAVLIVLSTVMLSLPSGVGTIAHAQSTDELRAQEEQAQRALEDARSEQAGVADELQDAAAAREAVATELGQATAAVDAVLGEIDLVEAEQAGLRAEVARLEEQADETRLSLVAQIRTLYIQGAADDVVLAFSADAVSEVSTRSHYLTALSRADRGRLERLDVVTTELSGRQQQLDTVDERLAGLREEAEGRQSELDRQLYIAAGIESGVADQLAEAESQARSLAAQAEQAARAVDVAEEAERQAAIAAAEEAERRAAAAAARAAAATAAAQAAARPAPSSSSSGSSDSSGSSSSGSSGSDGGSTAAPVSSAGKACPQDNPRSFTDTWGAPRSGGRSHQGTDIFGARGGNVFAITSGTVTRTSNGNLSGLFLTLRGDDGNDYWYLHLQDFVASPGQRVSAGELIGHNGDTGNARGTTPHIHFEYHPGGGGAVNPYPLLASIC